MAVGDALPGKAGQDIHDAGQAMAGMTEVTADLVQGNIPAAAKAFAGVLGSDAGKWVGDHVRDWAHSLGGHVGGFIGDGISAGGDAADDGLTGLGKTLGGAAFDKGVDLAKGDHSSNAGDTTHTTTNAAAPSGNDESLPQKAWDAVSGGVHDGVQKGLDFINNTIAHPESLPTLIANEIRDHFHLDPTGTIAKLSGGFGSFLGNNNGSVDTSHTSTGTTPAHGDGGTIGTSHAALTADTSGAGHPLDTVIAHRGQVLVDTVGHARDTVSGGTDSHSFTSALQHAMDAAGSGHPTGTVFTNYAQAIVDAAERAAGQPSGGADSHSPTAAAQSFWDAIGHAAGTASGGTNSHTLAGVLHDAADAVGQAVGTVSGGTGSHTLASALHDAVAAVGQAVGTVSGATGHHLIIEAGHGFWDAAAHATGTGGATAHADLVPLSIIHFGDAATSSGSHLPAFETVLGAGGDHGDLSHFAAVDPHPAPDTHTAAPIDHGTLLTHMAEAHHFGFHG
jgi:hypothetical protein